jgi:hypothetical protein
MRFANIILTLCGMEVGRGRALMVSQNLNRKLFMLGYNAASVVVGEPTTQ